MSTPKNNPSTQNGESGEARIMAPVTKVSKPENNVHHQPDIGFSINALIIRTKPPINKATASKLVNTTAVVIGDLNA